MCFLYTAGERLQNMGLPQRMEEKLNLSLWALEAGVSTNMLHSSWWKEFCHEKSQLALDCIAGYKSDSADYTLRWASHRLTTIDFPKKVEKWALRILEPVYRTWPCAPARNWSLKVSLSLATRPMLYRWGRVPGQNRPHEYAIALPCHQLPSRVDRLVLLSWLENALIPGLESHTRIKQ